MDLYMLREVIACQAYLSKSGAGWRNALDNLLKVGFPSSATCRTIRDRSNLLLNQFQRETNANTRRSGIEEDVSERTVLLEELLNQRQESERNVSEAKKKDDEDKAAGEAVRQLAMEGLRRADDSPVDQPSTSRSSSINSSPSPDLNTETPRKSRKRKREEDILTFMEEREKQRRQEKEEEFSLRRRELELHENRQEHDMSIMRQWRERDEVAMEERRVFLRVMQSFIEKLENKQ